MSVDLNAAAWRSQRWAARTSLTSAALAVLLPLGYGGLGGVLLLAAGLAGAAGTAAAVWWTLTRRGPERWLAAGLAVVIPALVLVLFVFTLGWVLVLSPVLWSVAVWSGRYALRSTGTRPKRMKEHRARSVRQPVLIMNPRSGGGKVEQFRLRERAEHLGARVVLLDPEGYQDVTALARAAVAEGADLLGVAGGDGTQALVAAVAAEHDLPFLVVCAGTRNHFAMDLGLDRTHPAACLDALTDGVELRVDLGFVADHPFVNNASFGAYAAVVQSPAYRDDKIGTTLELLPDLLTRQRGPHLTARIEATTIDGPQALLVSNNAYRTGDPVGLGRRERLDSGMLGILGVRVDSAAEAAALLLDPDPEGLAVLSAREVVVGGAPPHCGGGRDAATPGPPPPRRPPPFSR
ncbi:diacylglycerol/lipid kinase family protein [Streptomyces sp. NPDC003015]